VARVEEDVTAFRCPICGEYHLGVPVATFAWGFPTSQLVIQDQLLAYTRAAPEIIDIQQFHCTKHMAEYYTSTRVDVFGCFRCCECGELYLFYDAAASCCEVTIGDVENGREPLTPTSSPDS